MTKRKSMSSYVFTLCGNVTSWKSQLQLVVALSSTEAEYMATTEECNEAIWLKGLLMELKVLTYDVTLYLDSQSSNYLCKTLCFMKDRNTFR